ncbi:MAG: ATP-binding protein [Muribaculaceae bacterium]|nr:ATP-binding protein [Muribaculaceae bacterium]
MSDYPDPLVEALAEFGQKPTGNLDWDKALLDTLKRRNSADAVYEALEIGNVLRRAEDDRRKAAQAFPDMADPAIYQMHARLFLYVANSIVLAPQNRPFVVDDDNRSVIRFLLLYFNKSRLAEDIFPDRRYKLHKNIMLQGPPGVGKTLLMQCFSEYLRRTSSPRFFHNLSVTQMVNYYTIHNNLDRYTFNEEDSKGFCPKPENVCLNDVGLNDDKVFYGMNTAVLTDDFLLARNDIWATYGKFAHITTNLTDAALTVRFSKGDKYQRIIDRFKTYNVIPLTGTSRR